MMSRLMLNLHRSAPSTDLIDSTTLDEEYMMSTGFGFGRATADDGARRTIPALDALDDRCTAEGSTSRVLLYSTDDVNPESR